MSYRNQFDEELYKLFDIRTRWLVEDLFSGKKKPPRALSRKTVNDSIKKMQLIASHALAKTWANTEFKSCVTKCKTWHIKGHGVYNKKINFDDWFYTHFPLARNFVYIFWGDKNKCMYIGKTNNGGSRPTSHFSKYWFGRCKRIDIYQAQYSNISKLECLGIHHFEPKYNSIKAATKKWTSSCPMCDVHKYIEVELRTIFKLRK